MSFSPLRGWKRFHPECGWRPDHTNHICGRLNLLWSLYFLVRKQLWPRDPALRDAQTDGHWQELSGRLILPINCATEQLKFIKSHAWVLSDKQQSEMFHSLLNTLLFIFMLFSFLLLHTAHMSTLYELYGRDVLCPCRCWHSNPGSNSVPFKQRLIRTNLM